MKFWPTISYTSVWVIGMLVTILGLTPPYTGIRRQIYCIGSIYGVFCLNSLIDLIIYFARAIKEDPKPTFGFMIFLFFLLMLGIVVFSTIFYSTSNTIYLWSVIILMTISFFGMTFIKLNKEICFQTIEGKDYKPRHFNF